jgi:hypothetical protein
MNTDNEINAETGAQIHKPMNEPEAAEWLRLSAIYLRNLRIAGRGPQHSRVGRRVIYRVEDLDRFLKDKQAYSQTSVEVASV